MDNISREMRILRKNLKEMIGKNNTEMENAFAGSLVDWHCQESKLEELIKTSKTENPKRKKTQTAKQTN